MIESTLRTLLANALEALAIPTPEEISLEHPLELSHGDFATNIALVLAKGLGENPKALAERIVNHIPQHELVSEVAVAGPGFINFHLAPAFFVSQIKEALQTPSAWGRGTLYAGQHRLIEHSSPNLFKPFHIGHMVNNAIGESLVRLTESQGATVTRLSWPSDVSPGIAKAVWGLLNQGKGDSFTIEDIGGAYVLGTRAYDELPEAKEEIQEINRQLYNNTPGTYWDVYTRGRDLSLSYFKDITARLGSTFDTLLFESESEKVGKAMVHENTPRVFEESDGAIIYRGSDEGLYDSVFITGEGFGTYLAKDLGLLQMKNTDYTFDSSITVTDIEQKQHFELVVSAATKVNPNLTKNVQFIQHGRLRFAEGTISSRLGNVPLITDILNTIKDEVRKNATREISEETVEAIAIGALKYTILRTSPGKNIIFEPERSLSLEGDSGLYLQYTLARAMSVLEKAAGQGISPVPGESLIADTLERTLYRFPGIVRRSAQSFEPHHVVQYVTEIASLFNSWYAAETILDQSDTEARLAVVAVVATTLKNGMHLLAIPTPEKI
jgi:arginyl-tRNA synthetase